MYSWLLFIMGSFFGGLMVCALLLADQHKYVLACMAFFAAAILFAFTWGELKDSFRKGCAP